MTGGEGAEKLCVPEPAYDLKAVIALVAGRRVGLLLRAKLKAPVGDLDRAAAAKGEDADAKASNPDRLVPVGEAERLFGEGVLLDENADGDPKTDFDPEPTLLPLGIAKGDDGFNPKAAEDRLDAVPLLVPASGVGDGVDFCPNTEGPFACANGEDVAA